MDVFPVLHTERLMLRKISADDIPSLVKHGNNKKIADYVLNIPHPYGDTILDNKAGICRKSNC